MFRHFPFNLWPTLLMVCLMQCQSKPIGIKPIYKELTEAVYASGNLMPKHEYKVFALAEGYLSRNMVEEGNMVEANQILFLVESTQQDARSRNAQDVYRQAAQNLQPNSPILAELEVAIQNAEIKMKNDSVNFFRQQKLKAANATTGFEFDKASLAYQLSSNEYLQQKSRYDKTKNQLYLEMRNAESQFKIQNQESGNYALKSKIKGIVYEIYKEEGESVKRNEAIALLGAEEEVYLKLAVDELDIDKIKLGQEILVKVDVFKGKLFKAKITKIYRMLDKQNQSFRVDAEFIEDYPKGLAGLTVEANIIVRQKPKALAIPKEYLVGEDSVWVKKGSKIEKVKIQKGVENYDFVEVLQGLSPQDEIFKK